MKQIVAVVKPFLAQQVVESIVDTAVHDLLIREVKGYGRQKNYLDEYGENEYSWTFLPKVEINVWVADEHADEVVEKIRQAARSDSIGDGKILVMPVADVSESG